MEKLVTNVLFLDIDGPLTTHGSRNVLGPCVFKPDAAAALEHLCVKTRPHIVVHSSWRKLPVPPTKKWEFPTPDTWWFWDLDWFRELCRYQDMPTMADCIRDMAPYKLNSNRGMEVAMWIDEHDSPEDRYVILDDEVWYFDWHKKEPWADRLLVIECPDYVGFTESQANDALSWWAKE